MSLRRIGQFTYYTHIPLVVLAMVLTVTISAVLYGNVSWRVILLVGFSTYLTYSLDNLIDWKKDQSHYESIQGPIQIYHKITYLLIPSAAIGIALLVLHSSNELRIGILLLGAAVAMSTTRFTNYRDGTTPGSKLLWGFFLNRLFISFVWTTVCVFLPIWYHNLPVMPITWHTFLYMYALIFSYAVIWKLEKSELKLQKQVFSSNLPSFLALLPLLAMFLVVYDIILGFAPLHNLVNLLPPIACMLGLMHIFRHPFNLQKKISLMTLILVLLCTLSAAVHLLLA